MRSRSHANRGKPLEDLIIQSNELYRRRKIAVIEKQPTEWIPLWDPRTGRVCGAKVEHKATVDFLGSFAGRPIAFDCKHVSRSKSKKGDRISLSEVQSHQAEFLDDWTRDGCPGFVLVSFDLSTGRPNPDSQRPPMGDVLQGPELHLEPSQAVQEQAPTVPVRQGEGRGGPQAVGGG
jgi:hypothetical protein